MSTLSQFAPFAGAGGIKSIQTGYVNAAMSSNGVTYTEDYAYRDISISSVNTSKSMPVFMGAMINGVARFNPGNNPVPVDMRFLSSTSVRCAQSVEYTGWSLIGRWYIYEMN